MVGGNVSEVTTVATGWGLSFVVVATYALWGVGRGKTIGRELGIGGREELEPESDSSKPADS